MKHAILATLMLALVGGCLKSESRDETASTTPANGLSATERDNTGVNDRDRSGSTKTPIDQNENQKDIDITANIRSRVVETKMSIDAQNAKIVTQNGKVTLRGPVENEEERARIEEIAVEVAGSGNVDNQLEVQP